MSIAAPAAWVAARRCDVPSERKMLCPGPRPGGRYFSAYPAGQSVDYTDWDCSLADVWRQADQVWGSWLGTPGADGAPACSDWVSLPTPAAAVALFSSAPMTPWSEDWESGRSTPTYWDVPGLGPAVPQLYAIGRRIVRWVARRDWRARAGGGGMADVLLAPLAERAAAVRAAAAGDDVPRGPLGAWARRVVRARARAIRRAFDRRPD